MPWPLWILGRLQRAIIIQVIMGFQMQICSMFAFLLVDFGEVLCSSANELQKTQILTILSSPFISPLGPFVFCLSFVNNSKNNETTPSTN